MRTMKWLMAAALAASVTGCIETVDQGYGYSDGYYGPSGYYAQPAYYQQPVNNYYTTYSPVYVPTRQVVTQTRYVAVPTPQREANRANDHRGDDRRGDDHRGDGGRGDQHHVDHPQANNNPQPANPHQGNSRDHDGDGRPDRRS